MRELPREILLDPRSLERGFFRRDRVRALIDEHQGGGWDHSEKLWALIQLELWLRTFIDVRTTDPLAITVASA